MKYFFLIILLLTQNITARETLRTELKTQFSDSLSRTEIRVLKSNHLPHLEFLVAAATSVRGNNFQHTSAGEEQLKQRKFSKSEEKKERNTYKKIVQMDLCNACAQRIAHKYVINPASKCGRLVERALKGKPEAVKELESLPDYC